MYTRHFRSPLTFESEKFFRGHKNPQKHILTIVKNIETQKYVLNVLTNT